MLGKQVANVLDFKILSEANTMAYPTANTCDTMTDMTSDDYTPSDDAAQLFARYKKARELEKRLLAEVKAAAPAELHAGATTAHLAKLTGLSDEVFRRIARAEGVERKREPTVGSLKPVPVEPVANPKRAKADPQD